MLSQNALKKMKLAEEESAAARADIDRLVRSGQNAKAAAAKDREERASRTTAELENTRAELAAVRSERAAAVEALAKHSERASRLRSTSAPREKVVTGEAETWEPEPAESPTFSPDVRPEYRVTTPGHAPESVRHVRKRKSQSVHRIVRSRGRRERDMSPKRALRPGPTPSPTPSPPGSPPRSRSRSLARSRSRSRTEPEPDPIAVVAEMEAALDEPSEADPTDPLLWRIEEEFDSAEDPIEPSSGDEPLDTRPRPRPRPPVSARGPSPMHHLRMTRDQQAQWRKGMAKHKKSLEDNLARIRSAPGDAAARRRSRHDDLKRRIGDVKTSSSHLSKKKRPRRHTTLSSRMMTSGDIATSVAAEKDARELAKDRAREKRREDREDRRDRDRLRREEEAERRRRQPQAHEISRIVAEVSKDVMGAVLDPYVRDAVTDEMHAAAALRVSRREPTSTKGDIAAAEARVKALQTTVADREKALVDRRADIAAVKDKMEDVSAIHDSLEAKLAMLPPDLLSEDREIVRRKLDELKRATGYVTPPRAPSPVAIPVRSAAEIKRRQAEYQKEMEDMRAQYRGMPAGTSTTETDLKRMRLHASIADADVDVRDTKRRLTSLEHERSRAATELRSERDHAAAAMEQRAGMRAPDLAADFVRAPWWTSPRPDSSVKSNSEVAARVKEIAKRKRRTRGMPSWAKPGASDTEFKRGISQISSKMAVLGARSALSAYIGDATVDEKSTDVFVKLSARDRELETLLKKFDSDKDWRQLSVVASSGEPKRKRRPRPRRSRSPPKSKRPKTKPTKAPEGKHKKPAGGFDNRFFV